jgi:hypothetical protein
MHFIDFNRLFIRVVNPKILVICLTYNDKYLATWQLYIRRMKWTKMPKYFAKSIVNSNMNMQKKYYYH